MRYTDESLNEYSQLCFDGLVKVRDMFRPDLCDKNFMALYNLNYEVARIKQGGNNLGNYVDMKADEYVEHLRERIMVQAVLTLDCLIRKESVFK